MNIKKAKEQIKNAMTAYFTKDEFGNYIIPPERQRPVFLMGPPGIGKTAIMEQIAEEFNVGLVSYSMTHHTRQSAIGLPFIEKKVYGGREYSVSEYTMSEIIASVYDYMETSGYAEGILFLDEINCVSETLTPAMLQFLQYKTFGRHSVPKGWIVVTAGNPPEYNDSVRDFDIATWDRLKKISVEPDYGVWKEYAGKSCVHPSVLSYLELHQENFYKIETTASGKTFVTARGWSDLSDMIKLFEKNSLTVDEDMISQYLQNDEIAEDFSVYYDLYNKYKTDYQIDNILSGNINDEIRAKANRARFDERLALTRLFIDRVANDARDVFLSGKYIEYLAMSLKNMQTGFLFPDAKPENILMKYVSDTENSVKCKEEIKNLSQDTEYIMLKSADFFRKEIEKFDNRRTEDGVKAYDILRKDVQAEAKKISSYSDTVRNELSNLFKFIHEVFSEGQEMTVLLAELTSNFYTEYFISQYGCEEYTLYSKSLCFTERRKDIEKRVSELL